MYSCGIFLKLRTNAVLFFSVGGVKSDAQFATIASDDAASFRIKQGNFFGLEPRAFTKEVINSLTAVIVNEFSKKTVNEMDEVWKYIILELKYVFVLILGLSEVCGFYSIIVVRLYFVMGCNLIF